MLPDSWPINVTSWCVFFCVWFVLAVFAHMSFIHSLIETHRGLRSVRCALQEKDLLIYRPLIRLALWRFYRQMMKPPPHSPSCVSQPVLPSPSNPVSVLYPLQTPITTPCTQVVMQFMGNIRLPFIAPGAPPPFTLKIRAHCGLNISWKVSLLIKL